MRLAEEPRRNVAEVAVDMDYLSPLRGEERHGERGAQAAAAVDEERSVGGDFVEVCGQAGVGDVFRAGDMGRGELIRAADVEHQGVGRTGQGVGQFRRRNARQGGDERVVRQGFVDGQPTAHVVEADAEQLARGFSGLGGVVRQQQDFRVFGDVGTGGDRE